MTTLGRPHGSARKRMLFMVITDRIMVMASRARMGITPVSSGMPKSCMGTAARSAMMRESTSSEGSSSPTWRLPISRIPAMIRMYRMMVRISPVNTVSRSSR